MTIHITPKPIPQWLMSLPKGALISSKEFAGVLGITSHNLNTRVKRSLAPRCCVINRKVRNDAHPTFYRYWKAYVVRNHIRKLIKESKNETPHQSNPT